MKFCPFAERTRLVLLAKKLPHEIINIDLRRKPNWFLEIYSKGKFGDYLNSLRLIFKKKCTYRKYIWIG